MDRHWPCHYVDKHVMFFLLLLFVLWGSCVDALLFIAVDLVFCSELFAPTTHSACLHVKHHLLQNCQCVYMHSLVRLQPQFDYATQSDRLRYMLVRKLNYWSKHFIPRYDRWRSLCHQQQQTASAFKNDGVRRARRSDESLYISYKVYMIITQIWCTVVLLFAVISEGRRRRPSTSGSQPQEKNLEPAQNAKSESNLMERIHAGVMWLSIE